MDDTTHGTAGGPCPGLQDDEFEQAMRTGKALLDAELDSPRAFFVASQYDNGTEFVHGHSATEDLDGKVYDLLAPLAVHIQQVATAANADPETVVDCAMDVMAQRTGRESDAGGERAPPESP